MQTERRSLIKKMLASATALVGFGFAAKATGITGKEKRVGNVTDFQDVLRIPSVMMGFGLPDDNLHAPNEKFHIPNFYRGIESIIQFFEKLGE